MEQAYQAVAQGHLNRKAGLLWNPTSSTTVRAAAFRKVMKTLLSSQTIEPTQVAGFNQFFDDIVGTDYWRYGTVYPNAMG